MATSLQQRLTNLKDFILKYNTYFKDGFDNVFLEQNGYVTDKDKPVFPADDEGSYFYLRLPNQLQADYLDLYNIADNRQGIGIRYDIVLVACVVNGDSCKILENMVSTLGVYNDDVLRITKMMYREDDIVAQELKGFSKEAINSAIQRFPDNIGIACVHFSFTIPFVFQKINCIQSPCTNC